MNAPQIPPIVHVDPELDKLVNDDGMDQLTACRLLYGGPRAPETTMIARPASTPRRPVPPIQPAPIAATPARGRRPVADVLRWLTGGARA